MNPIQRRADGFSRIMVEGQHITKLYVPYELACIPTIECLRKGKPILKKSYFYKTTNNYLAGTVTDFFPLYDHGKKDGVIAFTIWTGSAPLVDRKSRSKKTASSRQPAYECYTFSDLVGKDASLRDVLDEAKTAAKSSSHVMVWGESGTGKEVFAQAIHAESDRSGQPFIAENCAAIPENLLEAILFGTSKGRIRMRPTSPDFLKRLTEAHCFWMNSIPCRWDCRPNCCECFRKNGCVVSDRARKFPWTFVSSVF